MKGKLSRVFISILPLLLFISCSSKQTEILNQNELIVSEFGSEKIYLSEFEAAYLKNSANINKAQTDSLENLKRFLDVYVNFKMKIADAHKRGYDKDPAIEEELVDYQRKVGSTYIIEKELIEPNIKRMYDERKYEYRVSHIMIRPDSALTDGPRLKAEELLSRIKNGESFEELAAQYSEDEFSKVNGGDIYYLTSGMVVPEFEDAMKETPAGSVYPSVVATRFGYHIIKVTEKGVRVPQIKASHILIDFLNEEGVVDTAAARAKIQDIANRIENGESFSELAAQFSEDPGSAQNGGDLGYFERRMMVQPFDEAAFKLKEGELSGIVETSYGFHLILVTERKGHPSFEEDKENLKKIYRQVRYNQDLAKLIEITKQKYNYKVDQSVLNELLTLSDMPNPGKDYLRSEWENPIQNKIIFSMTTTGITTDSLVKFMSRRYEYMGSPVTEASVLEAADKLSNDLVLEIDALFLNERSPEFKSLMEDYRNGIFIFKLQDEEIWKKIDADSVNLYAFYEKNKENYRFPDRVSFVELFSRTDSLSQVYIDMVNNGADFDSLVIQHTERSGMRAKAGVYELKDVNFSDLYREANKISKPGELSPIFPNSGGFSVLKLIEKDPARIKNFDEARPEVAGGFQDEESKRLELEFNNYLNSTYNPKKYYDNLKNAFKQKN